MKTKIAINRWAWLLAAKVFITLFGCALVAVAADSGQNTPENSDPIIQKMKAWQEEMSKAFHDTWQGLRQDQTAKNLSESTLATASVDLREQQDSYTVRLNLPNRNLDKVEVNLSGDTLHIVAPAEAKAARYEQNIHLEGVAAQAALQIQRLQNDSLIVITVPKSPEVATTKPSLGVGSPLVNWDAWDRDVLERMDRMQREMDNIFNQSFAEVQNQSGFNTFFDQARFDSSCDIQDEGTKYVVRAYLPDRDMNNVNVTIEGQILKLEAKGESTQQGNKGNAVFSQNAQYSQILTLPGPVQTDKMTVDRKDNMLVVTLPKAQTS
jgi:HSP20 family molecular chaperone IbpA